MRQKKSMESIARLIPEDVIMVERHISDELLYSYLQLF